MPKVVFLKTDLTIEVPKGTEIFELNRYNIPICFGCTKGNCAVCKIKILAGEENLSKPNRLEIRHHLEEGCRLACQSAILGDVVIDA